MKGYSYPRRRFNREEEILLLNQEIIELKKRVETVEIKSFESESPVQQSDQIPNSLDVIRNIEVSESPVQTTPEFDQLSRSLEVIENIPEPQVQPTPKTDKISKSLEVVRNIGNFKISESDSTYKKEEPFEMEKEMEMEG